jgi:PEP-CTERM motif
MTSNTKWSVLVVAVLGLAAGAAGQAKAGLLLIPDTTVLGTDALSGPTFTVLGDYSATDFVSVRGVGTVDLASGQYTTNAAGVIVSPQTTNSGNHPGEISSGPGGFPFASVLIGNVDLGFFSLFPADATTGLGNATPPTDITVLNRTLGDLFGPGFSGITSGTILELRINDSNSVDNSGSILVSTVAAVPEPSTLAGAGIAVFLGLATAWHRRKAKHAA